MGVEPPRGIEPRTYALRGACFLAACPLAATMPRAIAQMALAALGFSADPVHEPVHGGSRPPGSRSPGARPPASPHRLTQPPQRQPGRNAAPHPHRDPQGAARRPPRSRPHRPRHRPSDGRPHGSSPPASSSSGASCWQQPATSSGARTGAWHPRGGVPLVQLLATVPNRALHAASDAPHSQYRPSGICWYGHVGSRSGNGGPAGSGAIRYSSGSSRNSSAAFAIEMSPG